MPLAIMGTRRPCRGGGVRCVRAREAMGAGAQNVRQEGRPRQLLSASVLGGLGVASERF